MFDNSKSTFLHNVTATYDEYVSQRDLGRAGRNQHTRSAVAASIALYHFREHVPPSLRPTLNQIHNKCPEYELIRGVANAGKHKHATMGKPLVENAHDIFERLVIVQYADEIGEYFHGKTVVKVRCSDGTVRNLDTALTRALNYWGDFLHTNGILEFTARPEPPIPGERFVAREDALRKMGLEARVGLDFKQDIEFLKFDESIGRAAPQNLDGMEFNANIYSVQKHIFDFKMTHPKIGEIVVSLPLTDQENLEYHLIFPDEREAFFKNLTISHRDELAKLINAEIEKLNLDDPALPPDQSK